MFWSWKDLFVVFNNLNNFLSETLGHVIDGLEDKFIAFLLEDVFFCNQVLNQFENKFLFRNSIGGKDRWIVEIDSRANCHQDLHILEVCLNCSIWIDCVFFTTFEQLNDIFLKYSVQIISVCNQRQGLDSLEDLLAVALLQI